MLTELAGFAIIALVMEEVNEDRMVEALFEYKGSRKVLCFTVSTICVEQELRDLGVTEPNVNLSAGLAKTDSENPNCFFRNCVTSWGLLLMWKTLMRFMETTGLLLCINPPVLLSIKVCHVWLESIQFNSMIQWCTLLHKYAYLLQ